VEDGDRIVAEGDVEKVEESRERLAEMTAEATPEAPEPEVNEAELLLDLEVWLQGSLDIAERLAEIRRSRPLSLVATKVEEALLWLTQVEGGTS